MFQTIELKDASLEYYPDFLAQKKADMFTDKILNRTNWKQDKIKLFGKELLQPRLTAYFGEDNKSYTYSGLKMEPEPFPEYLKRLKTEVQELTKEDFNVCLVNLYRDGQDSMGWHADDEKELGENPVIASVSLGAERMFQLKHKHDPTAKYKIRLQHGSLLIMKGSTQKFWKHQLPKTKKVTGPRVNLTFRRIL